MSEMTDTCVSQPLAKWIPSTDDIEQCARICHEANRAVCVINGDEPYPAWNEAPDWQRASAIEGVKFHFESPWADDRDSHDRWMECKLRDGWTYGAVKDPARKTHPCLLPRHALPESERIKDSLFKAICGGFSKSKREARGERVGLKT